MKNLIKKLGIGLFLGLLGLSLVYGQAERPLSERDLPSTLRMIADILFYILMLVGVIMIVIGGIQMATAAGDEERVKEGRRTILWAIVAVIIAALARTIIIFISNRLT